MPARSKLPAGWPTSEGGLGSYVEFLRKAGMIQRFTRANFLACAQRVAQDAQRGDASVLARASRLLRYLVENFGGFSAAATAEAEADAGPAPEEFFAQLSRLPLAPSRRRRRP